MSGNNKIETFLSLADIIVRFCTSLHSKFQIRDWFKLTSAERRLVRLLADVTFIQSRIWNLEWSEGRKCTIISTNIAFFQIRVTLSSFEGKNTLRLTDGYVGRFDSCSQAELARLG